MPYVTTNVKTFGIQNYPESADLQIVFSPSSAAVAPTRVYPQDDIVVDVPSSGDVSVNFANVALALNIVTFTVRFTWLEGGIRRWSELDGRLRVPPEGGDLMDLLEMSSLAGATLVGLGAPPDWLESAIYWDVSGPKPVLYSALGAMI